MASRLAALALVLLCVCDRSTPVPEAKPRPVSDDREIPAAELPTPTAKAPAPSELPICKTADDPLAAICKLGAPAMDARFECATPEPLMFCGAFDEWTCRYMAIAGEMQPPVTYRARFDHEGAPIEIGAIIDSDSFKRTGIVRGVGVYVQEKDDAAGIAKAAQWSAALTSWGCAVSDEYGKTKVFACGAWEAETTYNEIIDMVIVEVALIGFRECNGT